jgi:hypothetical protein
MTIMRYIYDLLYFLMTQESGHDSFLMCDVSLDILYILYISFLSIFMWHNLLYKRKDCRTSLPYKCTEDCMNCVPK